MQFALILVLGDASLAIVQRYISGAREAKYDDHGGEDWGIGDDRLFLNQNVKDFNQKSIYFLRKFTFKSSQLW